MDTCHDPDAGISNKVSTNRGFVFIPEKDDIVLVGFRYDDPKRPFVMGSLFNGKTGTGGDSGNKKKSLTTRSGCTLTIDDDEGSITMTDQAGNSYAADGKGNIKISASKSIMLCVGKTALNWTARETSNPPQKPRLRKRPPTKSRRLQKQ